MKVLKFGGSSVGTPERIKGVIKIVTESINRDENPVVIFSAFQGITDLLIEAGKKASAGKESYKNTYTEIKNRHLAAVKELITDQYLFETERQVNSVLDDLQQVLYGIYLVKEMSPRSLDYVMSFGERLSAYIISQAFESQGTRAGFLDSRALIQTDDSFGNARVNFNATNILIKNYFRDKDYLIIITGFIGSTVDNETTTLGRGGSDYSAAIFGAALDAEEIEIWTDVDGVLTADPKKVKRAFSLEEMSYDEAMEMSHFGAKVLYPPTIRPALVKGIPIRIKNTFNPGFKGTLIRATAGTNKFPITGISTIDKVALVKIEGSGLVGVAGMAGRVFHNIAEAGINIILISQASSEHSFCFAILPDHVKKAVEIIKKKLKYEIAEGIISEVSVETDLSIIAVVGENLRTMAGSSGKVFQALGRNGVKIEAIAQGLSKLNISIVIGRNDEAKALNAIHDAFFLSDKKTINLFVVGTGLIGRTLFQQIRNQLDFLYSELRMEFKIIGIANTRKMLFDNNGISIDNWEERLFAEGETSNMETYIERMKASNLSNSIFVDCTSSEKIMSKYLEVLSSAISIVTPNKKANSSRYEYYTQLRKAAQKYNVSFLYETNVGAGLPVISTLHDLVFSGDKIMKIEGVLSGTLSYIFNTFDGSNSFSQIVIDAQKKGYTEPDPREDLNGLDVARKLLILVRESENKLELEDIEVENLIPADLRGNISTDDFLGRLHLYDQYFEEKRRQAAENGCVLRYIASYENGRATVKLRAVDSGHPFYSLASNDNKISFTTVYYNDRPIVIQGPGAGAKVTSGGIFADIVRIANHLW